VFDQSWAHAFESAGGRYYPKLQIAAPFSPVPGPRLLLRDDALAAPLLQAAETLVLQNGLSSAHASFVAPDQIALFEAAGWLIRTDSQFHWKNRDYADFDGFLAALSSRKRKNIRKERAAAQGAVRIERFTGDAIRAEHWDAFWLFYQDTGARKWGTPYLTRQAFDLLGQRLGDRIVLVLAFDGDQPIAGALNLLGPDTIYGRYWGALMDVPFLHFELCYYQAIDIAIERGLATVEAGAQGQHKLARGYEPTPTYSAHFIADEGFHDAVDDFLLREREAVAQEIEFLNDMGPFRKGS
jgi:predicted N-acyltransferase